MAASHFFEEYGCGTGIFTTEEKCPECGRKLRITGNINKIVLFLTCSDCGYQSEELSMEELHALM